MQVPQHWAEVRRQRDIERRTITVRRWGWSDRDAADAERHAVERAEEALRRIAAGEAVPRVERKLPYNGADGMPIREEVVDRHGDAVVTRNLYGARCLNVPDVLFADIDFASAGGQPTRTLRDNLLQVVAPLLLGLVLGVLTRSLLIGIAAIAVGGALAQALLRRVDPPATRVAREEDAAVRRVTAFLARHRDWAVRHYRTPAGLRLIATHRRFGPQDPAVADFFAAIGADPTYVRMCRNQQCFRARLSAKPWRIGIVARIGPRPGVWPVAADHLDRRRRWVQDYERRAQGYAACRFVGLLGADAVAPELRDIIDLHDRECRALDAGLPLA
jgi:hypothetical protein